MSLDEIIVKNDLNYENENLKNNENLIINNLSEIDENQLIIRNKRVRFPEEKSIVSDYFESKNYWNEQRFCSAEELMASYKKTCEIYNIKPIPILVEQIKGIDGGLCRERYDMLNLSNVKLDLRHVESMEEIFKRVQFKTLNFENTTLDDEAASSLFEIIEYYESCLKLNLSHNGKISYLGFNACSKMLKRTPCLETIELKGIIFTDSTIPPINRALRCGSNLRILHLENSNICSKNLLILSSALKLNINLRELHLAGNRMVPSDGIQLGSLLKVNKLLEMLDVRNNSLGDVGLSHICDGIADQCQSQAHKPDQEIQGLGLLCLILWSNSITYNGMPSLTEALKSTKSLQSLNLGNNPISSEGIHIIREGLLSNRSLVRLSLPCCKISCEGGVAIAEYLADTKQLMRLDIRDNDIRTAGLMAISLSMRVNKSVTRLDVDPNPKKDPNVKGFAETQTESLKIIQQRVQENKKIMLEKQEMELSQHFSLSIQSQDTDEIDSNTNLNHNDLILDENQAKNIKDVICEESAEVVKSVESLEVIKGSLIMKVSESKEVSESEEILRSTEIREYSEESHCTEVSDFTEVTSSTDRSDYVNHISAYEENSNVPLSLDLSPDIDSNMVFLNDFSSKVLSPSDTKLEFDKKSAFHLEEFKEFIPDTISYECDNDQSLQNDPSEISHKEDIVETKDGCIQKEESIRGVDQTQNTVSFIESSECSEPLVEDLTTYNDSCMKHSLEL